jgi:hypothetical protein
MDALEQFKLDGKLTEREHQWTVGIAKDVFSNVEEVTGTSASRLIWRTSLSVDV